MDPVIIAHLSYFALFVIMVVEGPVVTSAAAFAVHLGYFTLPAIFLLSVAGDLVGDFIYYGLGWASRSALIDRHGHRFGLDHDKLGRFDRAFHRHKIKSLVIAKLAPAIPGPVLIAAGALRMSLWTLVWISLVLAVPKYLFFMVLGYWFGDLYVTFFQYYDIVGWILAAALIIGSYWIYKKALKAVLSEAEE
ncbi:MAG TPA: VTT domain-containing protein [Candidatus Paceibacterota bacterium]|nr:VTT domain-containing protein [Candidatus Paceibacterota bacterium]